MYTYNVKLVGRSKASIVVVKNIIPPDFQDDYDLTNIIDDFGFDFDVEKKEIFLKVPADEIDYVISILKHHPKCKGMHDDWNILFKILRLLYFVSYFHLFKISVL